MSAYDYEHFVNDFIKRTQVNLSTIDEIAESGNESEVYEITQLINSLFGLLIVPFERYKKVEEDELKSKDGYNELVSSIKSIKRLYTNYEDDRDDLGNFKVSNFIKHLRNALAHLGNDRVLFLDEDQKLTGMLFYDNYKDKETNKLYEFCVELDINSFRQIVESIIKMYSDVNNEFNETYHNKILRRQKIFKRNK